MTFYAVYYTGDEYTTAPVNSSIAGYTVPEKGKTENLFGEPSLVEIGETPYVMAAFNPTHTGSEHGSQTIPGYREVGLVISTSADEVAQAPTAQGGYQKFSDTRVFAQSIQINGASYAIPNSNGAHYIMFQLAEQASSAHLYVTPYAITDAGVYVYGESKMVK